MLERPKKRAITTIVELADEQINYTDTVCTIFLVQSGIEAPADSDHTGTLGSCFRE